MKRFALIVISLFLMISCSPTPCSQQAADYIPALEGYFDEWDDTNTIANSTPRASLSAVIADLQAIRRNVDDLEHPDCVNPVQLAIVAYMDASIDGYLAFMSQAEDSEVSKHMSDASDFLLNFMTEFTKLKAGDAPYD